jgi:hypothetical protein
MTNEYFPLHIWLQPVDDFGVEVGDAKQTFNLDLLHAQIGDRIKNPRYVSEEIDAHLQGEWVVQEREFTEHKTSPQIPIPRNFTLYVRQP